MGRVFGNLYGTPRKPIEDALEAGRDVLFDIDWQGTQQLSERMSGDIVRVFILPPSGAALEQRLKTRAQDPPEVVARRMAQASSEISHWAEYDYVIINSNLDESLASLKGILAAERVRRETYDRSLRLRARAAAFVGLMMTYGAGWRRAPARRLTRHVIQRGRPAGYAFAF